MSPPLNEYKKRPPFHFLLEFLIVHLDEIYIFLFALLAYPLLCLPIYICFLGAILKGKGFSDSDWIIGGLFIVTPAYFSAIYNIFSQGFLFSWPRYLLANAAILSIGLLFGYFLKNRAVSRRFAFLLSSMCFLFGFLIPSPFSPSAPSPAPAPVSDSSFHSASDLDLEEVPKTTEVTGCLSRTAYWTAGGGSYHFSKNCTSLKRSRNIISGTLQEALDEGKTDPCNLCAEGS